MKFELLTRSSEAAELARRLAGELALTEPAQTVLDADWQPIRTRPASAGFDVLPHDRPRSVVLPAALLTLGICGAPILVFALAEVVAR